jgi:hypothetical protein
MTATEVECRQAWAAAELALLYPIPQHAMVIGNAAFISLVEASSAAAFDFDENPPGSP